MESFQYQSEASFLLLVCWCRQDKVGRHDSRRNEIATYACESVSKDSSSIRFKDNAYFFRTLLRALGGGFGVGHDHDSEEMLPRS